MLDSHYWRIIELKKKASITIVFLSRVVFSQKINTYNHRIFTRTVYLQSNVKTFNFYDCISCILIKIVFLPQSVTLPVRVLSSKNLVVLQRKASTTMERMVTGAARGSRSLEEKKMVGLFWFIQGLLLLVLMFPPLQDGVKHINFIYFCWRLILSHSLIENVSNEGHDSSLILKSNPPLGNKNILA